MSALTLLRGAPAAVPAHEEDSSQYLSFQLAGEAFAIGILSIREILEYEHLTEVPLMPDFIRGVMNLRGAVVPVIDLAMRFGRAGTELQRRTCIVIVEVEDGDGSHQMIGILVDAVHEVLTIRRGEIEPPPAFGAKLRTDFIAGMARVDAGFIILLNLGRVLSVEEMTLLASVEHEVNGAGEHEPVSSAE